MCCVNIQWAQSFYFFSCASKHRGHVSRHTVTWHMSSTEPPQRVGTPPPPRFWCPSPAALHLQAMYIVGFAFATPPPGFGHNFLGRLGLYSWTWAGKSKDFLTRPMAMPRELVCSSLPTASACDPRCHCDSVECVRINIRLYTASYIYGINYESMIMIMMNVTSEYSQCYSLSLSLSVSQSVSPWRVMYCRPITLRLLSQLPSSVSDCSVLTW